MSPAEFKKLLDRYFHGECSPEEVAFVEKWYENIEVNEPINDAEADTSAKRIWAAIKPARKLSAIPYFKVAAAVALIGLAAVMLIVTQFAVKNPDQVAAVTVKQYNNQLIESQNNTSNTHVIVLSDGSTIELAPESSVRYPQSFSGDERVVVLSGEAFFNVKKDPSKPFIVYSNEIVTRVLGTSFRITAFDDQEEIVVAVKTGKVSVYPNPGSAVASEVKDIILTPNQQMVFKRSEDVIQREIVPAPEVVSVDSAAYFQMQFDGMPVTRIFDVLEKNYGIDIQYDAEALKACILTTKMTEEGFHQRIDVICKAINAHYTKADGAVIISGKGCD